MLIAAIPIGNGLLNAKMLEDMVKKLNIQMKINYNELQRLFNRTQIQLNELSNVCKQVF